MARISLRSHRGDLRLGRGELLVLEDAAGCRLTCLEGEVVITEPGRPEEIQLRRGEDHAIAVAGKVLAEAGGEARLRLRSPQGNRNRWHRWRARFGRVALFIGRCFMRTCLTS